MITKIIISFFLMISGGIGIVFYVQPLWQKFHAVRKETDYLARVSLELDTLIENRDLLLKKINSISRDDLTRINAAAPKSQEAASFLVFLEALIEQHGLALTSINLSGTIGEEPDKPGQTPRPQRITARTEAPGGLQEFPVSLGIAGSYSAVKSFIQDLEVHTRITDVETISLAPQDPVTKVELKIKTYYHE